MDNILLGGSSDSDSDDDDNSNLDGKDTSVSTVAAIVQQEREKQAAEAAAAAKFKQEQDRLEQEMQRKRREELQLQQKQKQLKERQAAAAAAAEAKRNAPVSSSMNMGMTSAPYSTGPNTMHPSSTSSNTTSSNMGNTNAGQMSSNQNNNLPNYGMRSNPMSNPSQPSHSQQQHSQPSHSRSNAPPTSSNSVPVQGLPSSVDMIDFEPTPLRNLIKRPSVPAPAPQPPSNSLNVSSHSHKQPSTSANTNTSSHRHPTQSSHSQHPSSQQSSSQPSSSHRSSTGPTSFKNEKEYFLMFTKVLMKYLEQKNPQMHQRAKAVIRECAERNKQNDPEYASLTQAMKRRLRETVGQEYWRKANDYLQHFMKQNKKKAAEAAAAKAAASASAGGGSSGAPSSVMGSTSVPKPASQQQQQQQQMQQSRSQMTSQSIPQPMSGVPTPSIPSYNRNVPPNSSQPSRTGTANPLLSAPNPLAQNQPPNASLLKKAYQHPVQTGGIPPPHLKQKPMKATVAKKTQKVKNTLMHKSMQKMKHTASLEALNDNANKLIANMTPAQQKVHLAARNAALGLDSNSSRSSTTTSSVSNKSITGASPYAPPNSSMMPNSNVMLGKAGSTLPPSATSKGVGVPTNPAVRPPTMTGPNAINVPGMPRPNKKSDTTKGKLKKGDNDANAKVKSGLSAAGISYTLPGGQQVGGPMAKGKMVVEQHKEYEELMEELDHAALFDWKSAIAIVPKETLLEEQKNLLYGQTKVPDWVKLKMVVDPVESSATTTTSISTTATGGALTTPSPSTSHVSLTMNNWQMRCKGWGKTNVVTPATAWACLRLVEEEEQERIEKENQLLLPPSSSTSNSDSNRNNNASNAIIPKTETSNADITTTVITTITTKSKPPSPYVWYNEEKAEEDQALALLSEATQTFLKSLLEGAVNSARQRQNLEATRLWYAQHGPNPYPLTLRLGCDIKRQVALAQANAAKTCQRLEEALTRSNAIHYEYTEEDDDKMMYLSTSMYDLSKYPPTLGESAGKAEQDAKRSFEIYGGKESRDPPFGRVPAKKCKIMVKDFKSSMVNSAFPWKMKGLTASAFI